MFVKSLRGLRWSSRGRLELMIAIYIACVVMMNLMGAKVVPLGSIGGMQFNISVGVLFLMPLLSVAVDSICEVYGKARAWNVIKSGLVVIFLMTGFAALAVAMPAAERFTAAPAYDQIFAISVRFGLASLVAFMASSILDLRVYSKLRAYYGERKKVWLRSGASNMLGQLVDTVIFVVIAFYNPGMSVGENVNFMVGIIIPLTIVKCLLGLAAVPFVYGGIRILKGKEEVKDELRVHTGADANRPAA
ncbi:queuosine precursor transporter [Candidatus Saccharibacteria bacterium]|nr:queuosine precursor transporter [Candidatus Saccharibacteria bacterium]